MSSFTKEGIRVSSRQHPSTTSRLAASPSSMKLSCISMTPHPSKSNAHPVDPRPKPISVHTQLSNSPTTQQSTTILLTTARNSPELIPAMHQPNTSPKTVPARTYHQPTYTTTNNPPETTLPLPLLLPLLTIPPRSLPIHIQTMNHAMNPNVPHAFAPAPPANHNYPPVIAPPPPPPLQLHQSSVNQYP